MSAFRKVIEYGLEAKPYILALQIDLLADRRDDDCGARQKLYNYNQNCDWNYSYNCQHFGKL